MTSSVAAAVAVIILATAFMQLNNKTLDFYIASFWSKTSGLAAFSHPESQKTLGDIPKTRVCLNMIVKNEEQDMIKFLRSVKDHITGFVICDTGSTDKTISLAESFFHSAGIRGIFEHHTWINFAASRNLCLDAGRSQMADICDFWLILEPDHVFTSEKGILLSSLDLSAHTSYYLEERNEGTVYNTRRLVSTKLRWAYVGAIHEYITVVEDVEIDGLSTTVEDKNDGGAIGNLPQGMYAHHNIKFSLEKYENYREMLEKEIDENPNDPRSRYYLGQTYQILEESDKAIVQWLARIQLGPSTWVEERYMAALDLASELEKIYNIENKKLLEETKVALSPWLDLQSTRPTLNNVIDGFLIAANMLPYRQEAWYHVAKLYRTESTNYEKCYEYAKKAKASGPHTAETLFSQADVIDFHIDDELCICGYYVQEWSAEEACKRVISNVDALEVPEVWQIELKKRTLENIGFYSTSQET